MEINEFINEIKACDDVTAAQIAVEMRNDFPQLFQGDLELHPENTEHKADDTIDFNAQLDEISKRIDSLESLKTANDALRKDVSYLIRANPQQTQKTAKADDAAANAVAALFA